jgi:hypothetical protein
MKTTKALFSELMYDFQSECWNEFELPKLSLQELLSLAKRALAAGLMNWRDRCRARGQAFLAEMRSLAKDRPQQLSFRFQDLKSF